VLAGRRLPARFISDNPDYLVKYVKFSPTFKPRTWPVGTSLPNAFGFFDFHGNVAEWCHDWFGPYPVHEVTDSMGPKGGKARVYRGGDWRSNYPNECWSAQRYAADPAQRDLARGFRVVFQP